MPCNKIALQKAMARVRRQYPSYGIKRRKKIARALIYGKRR